jgi:hypothetical protein
MDVETQGKCSSCHGTGEVGSEVGPVACPDCGGAGALPSRSTLIEWRARDIERSHGAQDGQSAADIRWLISELRKARAALTEVVSVAQDLDDSPLTTRMRFVANDALGLYEVREEDPRERAN